MTIDAGISVTWDNYAGHGKLVKPPKMGIQLSNGNRMVQSHRHGFGGKDHNNCGSRNCGKRPISIQSPSAFLGLPGRQNWLSIFLQIPIFLIEIALTSLLLWSSLYSIPSMQSKPPSSPLKMTATVSYLFPQFQSCLTAIQSAHNGHSIF